jgi:hypothetical protein
MNILKLFANYHYIIIIYMTSNNFKMSIYILIDALNNSSLHILLALLKPLLKVYIYEWQKGPSIVL